MSTKSAPPILTLLQKESLSKSPTSSAMLSIEDELVKYLIAYEPWFKNKGLGLQWHFPVKHLISASDDAIRSVMHCLLGTIVNHNEQPKEMMVKSQVCDASLNITCSVTYTPSFQKTSLFQDKDMQVINLVYAQYGWSISYKWVDEVAHIEWTLDYAGIHDEVSQNLVHFRESNNSAVQSSELSLFNNSVLILEPNLELNGYLGDIFSTHYKVVEHGFNLATVSSHAVISLLADTIPDVIITDSDIMCRHNFALLSMIASHDTLKLTPIYILCSVDDIEYKLQALSIGCEDVIEKPFLAPELLLKVNRCVLHRKKLLSQFANQGKLNHRAINAKPHKASQISEKLQKIVENNYQDASFSALSLAEKMAMSERTLQRNMLNLGLGKPSQFIKDFRLNKAYLLLLQGKPIQYSADICGFKNVDQFSRSFIRKYDIKPSSLLQAIH
ncbi:helix-turn-helix domain-containing protein [Glaciecola sp. MH2013]|uniref:helix-turn-helix domain-containing protein n=1 Tax=Glaciecola sp. MH2013 TaxID=2785524 RepID=UPI00189FD45F|nr:helix-turn-helix domain-containing protein [Glaciecola sp. MH2013]MBF7074482.1 helix-turn-helix domain-containing protein [Glaciecola sp. MH2013]